MITRAYFIDDIFVRSTGVQHLESTKFRYQFGYIITKKITRISVYGLQKIQKKKEKKRMPLAFLFVGNMYAQAWGHLADNKLEHIVQVSH